MKVIFLDIDGVLNTPQTRAKCGKLRGVERKLIDNLRHVVAMTQAKLVLTSAWKVHFDDMMFPTDETGAYLYRRLFERGLWIYDKVGNGERGAAIHAYLAKHKSTITHWVVLDDEIAPDFDKVILSHLVKVSAGITRTPGSQVTRMLGVRARPRKKESDT